MVPALVNGRLGCHELRQKAEVEGRNPVAKAGQCRPHPGPGFHQGRTDGQLQHGAGLHACAAGKGHGADLEAEPANSGIRLQVTKTLHVPGQRVIVIAIKKERRVGGKRRGPPGGPDDIRRLAAFSAGDEQIAIGKIHLLQVAGAVFRMVLETFQGVHQRHVASRHEGAHLIAAGVTLPPEKLQAHGEPAGGAAAAEVNAATAAKGRLHGPGQLLQSIRLAYEPVQGRQVHGLESGHAAVQITLRPARKMPGAGMGLFGRQGAQMIEMCRLQEFSGLLPCGV